MAPRTWWNRKPRSLRCSSIPAVTASVEMQRYTAPFFLRCLWACRTSSTHFERVATVGPWPPNERTRINKAKFDPPCTSNLPPSRTAIGPVEVAHASTSESVGSGGLKYGPGKPFSIFLGSYVSESSKITSVPSCDGEVSSGVAGVASIGDVGSDRPSLSPDRSSIFTSCARFATSMSEGTHSSGERPSFPLAFGSACASRSSWQSSIC
mmetsp:Transcript_34522/g.68746  ORF Transcript_34522/g.68746 Transcript_34522/m.68746 type:complete len:209 (+) Transcript_34522:763-1389(+)